jgi:hypothetical protein
MIRQEDHLGKLKVAGIEPFPIIGESAPATTGSMTQFTLEREMCLKMLGRSYSSGAANENPSRIAKPDSFSGLSFQVPNSGITI